MGVISKLPALGHTKTRLARTLGPEAALQLHRAFLADELEELHRPDRWDLFLVHDGADTEPQRAELRVLAGDRAQGLAPGGIDLAHDLRDAFAALLEDRDRAVIVSGDVPHLPHDVVADALAALEDADVVLGPGPDGGYYLVGLRRPHDLFTSVPMGTGAVFAATCARAAELGLTVARAPRTTDLDEAQDLAALAAAPPHLARHTRAALEGLERRAVAPLLPTELQVEATSRCNLRCSGCIRTHAQPEPDADLTLADFVAITRDLPDLRRVVFQLNGESLLNPELFAMIEHARGRAAHTILNSNGTLLDPDRRAALLSCGLDELRISLDGARPETVRRMTGADTLSRVIEGARALIRERGPRSVPRVSLWMVATRHTLPELPELVRLAADLGVEEVYVQRLVLTGRGVARVEHTLHERVDDATRAIVERAERLATELGIALRASGRQPVLPSLTTADPARPRVGCWRPWRSAVVTAHKRVLPCCISSFTTDYDALELGDLCAASWAELWNGRRYRALRRGILTDDCAPSCEGCGELWSL